MAVAEQKTHRFKLHKNATQLFKVQEGGEKSEKSRKEFRVVVVVVQLLFVSQEGASFKHSSFLFWPSRRKTSQSEYFIFISEQLMRCLDVFKSLDLICSGRRCLIKLDRSHIQTGSCVYAAQVDQVFTC